MGSRGYGRVEVEERKVDRKRGEGERRTERGDVIRGERLGLGRESACLNE